MKYLKDLWDDFNREDEWTGTEFQKFDYTHRVVVTSCYPNNHLSKIHDAKNNTHLFIVSNEIELEVLVALIQAVRE